MDLANTKEVLEIVTSVIGIASIFAAFLPQPAGGILLALKKAIDMGAFNFLHAKNQTKTDNQQSLEDTQ
jgi:hypothetical protein